MKIGIVEDELIIADSIAKLLQEMNYAVTEPAISFAEAVEMLEEEKPDLVLVDIQLRGKKDGIDLALYINEHCGIPFISYGQFRQCYSGESQGSSAVGFFGEAFYTGRFVCLN
jgi:CheY-like chemotaxis protein